MKLKNIKIFARDGFSLIELIVSIAIIGTISATFLVNYTGSNRRNEIILASQQMVSNIRLAQNNTLGSVEYNGQVPAGGWGVYLDLNSNAKQYIIFADIDEDLEYDSGEANPAYGGKTITLPADISITETSLGDELHITFLPPDPVTNIWDGSSTSTEVYLTLTEGAEGSTKRIYLNFFGLIEAIN